MSAFTQKVSANMTDFYIKKLPYDLTSNAGLALVGQYMKRLGVSARVDRQFSVGVGSIANSDILKSYLGFPSSTPNPGFRHFLTFEVNKIKHLARFL
jgi:hypothetical protein